MGFRSRCVVTMSAVVLLLSMSFDLAQAAPEPDCGPQFNQLTTANVIPSYRQAMANREALTAFHHSIPADYKLFVTSKEAIRHIHDCYMRIEGLLAQRAEAGDVEAQFVLGHLLLYAYNPLFGGYVTFSEEADEGRKQGHDWLVKADKADHFDAAEALTRFYSMQLDFAVEPHRGGALSNDPPLPWLPDPKEMLEWLKQAGPRGHPIAYAQLFTHYVKRYPFADQFDPAKAQGYRELSEHYHQLSKQALDAAESSGSGD